MMVMMVMVMMSNVVRGRVSCRYEPNAGDNARDRSRAWARPLQPTRLRHEPVLQRIQRTVPARK